MMNHPILAFSTPPLPTTLPPQPHLCNRLLRDLSRTKDPGKALHVFDEMLRRGSGVDRFSFPLVFKAAGRVKAVDEGMMVHGLVVKMGFADDSFVETGLVGMYAFCGEFDCARMVFDRMSERDIVTWNIMIDGYCLERFKYDFCLMVFHLVLSLCFLFAKFVMCFEQVLSE